MKTMSLRLDQDLAAELAFVARADGQTISDVVREAVDKHIAERRAAEDFKERLKKQIEKDRKVFERLAR